MIWMHDFIVCLCEVLKVFKMFWKLWKGLKCLNFEKSLNLEKFWRSLNFKSLKKGLNLKVWKGWEKKKENSPNPSPSPSLSFPARGPASPRGPSSRAAGPALPLPLFFSSFAGWQVGPACQCHLLPPALLSPPLLESTALPLAASPRLPRLPPFNPLFHCAVRSWLHSSSFIPSIYPN
jgi:hypothetical protein